ncbi:hypothetical protein BDZ89DRAFT_833624 [Hymenopellis radicata]|nr:hypothetical protein BDZ89DRAFT_833624 [Hymenopellis radicata]
MECPNCHENIHRSHLAEYQAIFTETHHLKELRTTNNPASEDDVAYVHDELLPAIENDITTLEKRMTDLRLAIELLMEEKNDLTKLANNFKSLISPHRRLPPELLMEIFKYACEKDCDDWDVYRRGNSASPHVLACVCSGWRQVALSCPVIWSRISLYSEDSEKRHYPSFSEALDTTLCRSRNSPLYITLSSPWLESAERTFLEHVSVHSSRWSAITLDIDSAFADTAFQMLCRSYPSSIDSI